MEEPSQTSALTEKDRTTDMATRLQAIPHRRASTRHGAGAELAAHYKKLRELHLRQIFQEETPQRGEHPTAEAPGIDTGASLRLMCSALR